MAIASATGFTWPWQDRQARFSPLRAGALVVVLLPAVSMLFDLAFGFYGDMPVHGFLYWSGIWATALLLLVLAVTPARTILRWNRLIAVRRTIGLAALAYTVFHVVMYFALDSWNFAQVAFGDGDDQRQRHCRDRIDHLPRRAWCNILRRRRPAARTEGLAAAAPFGIHRDRPCHRALPAIARRVPGHVRVLRHSAVADGVARARTLRPRWRPAGAWRPHPCRIARHAGARAMVDLGAPWLRSDPHPRRQPHRLHTASRRLGRS